MSDKEEPTNPINDLLEAMNSTGNNEDEFVPTTDVELTHEIVQTLFNVENLNMITSLSPRELSDVELTHEIVQTLFDVSNLNMISSLSARELSGVVKMYTINEIIHNGQESVLTKMIHNFLTLKVSDNRLGRRELIQAIIGRQADEVSNGGLINRFIH